MTALASASTKPGNNAEDLLLDIPITHLYGLFARLCMQIAKKPTKPVTAANIENLDSLKKVRAKDGSKSF